MELSDEVATADEPDVPGAGGGPHRVVHRPHVAAHEADVGAVDGPEAPGWENTQHGCAYGHVAGRLAAGLDHVAQHPA